MKSSMLVLGAMLCASPACASPVTWDYTVTSCVIENNGSPCSGDVVGSNFSTFSADNQAQANDYILDDITYQPHFTSGTPDFSLSVDGLSIDDGSDSCGCSWNVAYNVGSPPYFIDLDTAADEELTLRGNEWTNTIDALNIDIMGTWSDVSSPVDEPGSSFLWVLCGLFILTTSTLIRKRAR